MQYYPPSSISTFPRTINSRLFFPPVASWPLVIWCCFCNCSFLYFDTQSVIYLTDGLSLQVGARNIINYLNYTLPSSGDLDLQYYENKCLLFQRAMEDIGLKSEEICDIFKIVSSVLKLGNLQFVPTTNMDGTEGCSIANEYGELLLLMMMMMTLTMSTVSCCILAIHNVKWIRTF